ncbi:hypothetical protein WOJGOHIN_CDS0080 [Staphylococcus phage PG-2021_87]
MSKVSAQEYFIERLKQEGLEVTEGDNYCVVEDVEGHIAIVDFVGDIVNVSDNEGVRVSHNVNQIYLAFYAVLDVLDYEFDE